jgi:glycine/D-amino acid oxidase-like deaminating enzyme
MGETEYAIIGGGIVGASVAYHLSERTTESVVVYEREELASETTFRSTAMIGVAGPDPYYRMKEDGFRLYNEFFAEPAARPQYRQAGRLRVATSTNGARELSEVATAAPEPSEECGHASGSAETYANSPVSYIPGDKLKQRLLVPPLATDLIEGSLYRPQYGYIQDDSRTFGPRELAMEFIERARDNGVTFETDTEVTAIDTQNGRVTSIETNDRCEVDVDAVVCAAGPWNRQVASLGGLDLPLGYVPSPVFALKLDESLSYSLPMIKSHESSVGIHPKGDDVVLVTYTPDEDERPSRCDPAAVGDTAPDEYRETALRWAKRLLPALQDAELVDEWVGVGTSTPDGKPIVGWTDIEGLSLAVTRSGIQYAPAVGSIVARQLVDGDPTEYYAAVSISRFDGWSDQRATDGTL